MSLTRRRFVASIIAMWSAKATSRSIAANSPRDWVTKRATEDCCIKDGWVLMSSDCE